MKLEKGKLNMIDINNLEVGDVVFYVSKTFNYPRNRYKMVDEHGVEWFRHDDTFIYKITKMIVSGYVDTVVTGTVCQSNINPREYFFYNEDGHLLDYTHDKTDQLFVTHTFRSELDAEQFIHEQKEKEKT
jgi:hypothetical protein